MYNGWVKYEWDENKNRLNISKHGFDFNDARFIFDAPMLVIPDTREDYGEDRYIGIGILRRTIVIVVFTENTDEVIRVISLRKATKNERKIYQNKFQD
jgi:uncharacterized DUF497 family protein